MKRILLAIVTAFVMMTSANAQRLTNIYAEATFITDQMIMELGLNSSQRNGILNINLSYLKGINSYRDIDAYGCSTATSRSDVCSQPDNGESSESHTTSIAR